MKQEPTLGNLFGLIETKAKSRKDPAEIVNGAFVLFDEAQQKLADAEREIQTQIDEDQAEIIRLTSQVADGAGQISRLQRVSQRFSELLK